MKYYLEKIKRIPTDLLIKKVMEKIKKKILANTSHLIDLYYKTYIDNCNLNVEPGNFRKVVISSVNRQIIRNIADLYCNHYFDLLGSGWIQVKHGVKCLGLEGYDYNSQLPQGVNREGFLQKRINRSNYSEAILIYQLINSVYQLIDWQLDFKSGYRWSEKTWYVDIPFGHKPGVDIKVPWELARMQHLSMLAWEFSGCEDVRGKRRYLYEFRNQILDFIANNPPRYGVNWRCTMDVGIRVVNWLVAYDMFISFGADFDEDFKRVFTRSIYEHGKHCYNNLEYQPEHRNNHYLSDIAGLLFVAAHLDTNEETGRWLAFALQELISEMAYEFNEDGSNFEASTNYHRLSTEIMLYCSILCLSLSKDKKEALLAYDESQHKVKPKLKKIHEQEYDLGNPQLFPDWFWERLERACEFTMHINKSTGETPQVGDNDSGRFLKIWPSYIKRTVAEAVAMYKNLEGYNDLPPEAEYWDENILDHRHILGIAGVIFNRQDFISYVKPDNPEVSLVSSWLNGKTIASYLQRQQLTRPKAKGKYIKGDEDIEKWVKRLTQQCGDPITYIFSLADGTRSLNDDLEIYSYPDFGLYTYKSPVLYLSVRCGSIGQNGIGGHAHNDQLSIELTLDGEDIISDPGTYLYTPLPTRRNEFRSIKAHFTPQIGEKEQNEWYEGTLGLFNLSDYAKPEALYFNFDGFVGKHIGFGGPVYRIVLVTKDIIKVCDFGSAERYNLNQKKSRGYGKWDK